MSIAELYSLIRANSSRTETQAPRRDEEPPASHQDEQAFAAAIEKAMGVPAVLVRAADGEGLLELRLRYESTEELASITAKLTLLMTNSPGLKGGVVLTSEIEAQLLAVTALK